MENRWNESDFKLIENNLLDQRVYSSRLLGAEPELVLHGGGNTSVKIKEINAFGEEEEILYVKGSGWDLATIKPEGFAPVKQEVLLKMAKFKHLSDIEMVRLQRTGLTNPDAPNPSVEAILHAIIPFKFVDHTHADAVVTISNTPDGFQRIQSIYGKNVLIVPYVMPGFILAKAIYERTKNLDWAKLDAIILMNHGVFTFHDSAQRSYSKMIEIVQLAEDYLKQNKITKLDTSGQVNVNSFALEELRKTTINATPATLEKVANGVVHPVTKETITKYKKLIEDPLLRETWAKAMCKELGRLCQGFGETEGTDTMRFLDLEGIKNIPKDRVVTYTQIVVDYRPQKADPDRVRITAGGNLIQYPGELTTRTSDLRTTKIMLNSVISTEGARYMTADAANFYLATPMKRKEYLRIAIELIPQEFMDLYDLHDKVKNGYVYCEIVRGMYGLPQAGNLANKLHKERLAVHD